MLSPLLLMEHFAFIAELLQPPGLPLYPILAANREAKSQRIQPLFHFHQPVDQNFILGRIRSVS
jgi:hypothetical protein